MSVLTFHWPSIPLIFPSQSYSDTDDSCPACITKNEKIYDILDSQSKKIAQEDEFHQRMETAEDKFAVVSEYMGLGVFKANAGSASGLGSSAKEARKAGRILL